MNRVSTAARRDLDKPLLSHDPLSPAPPRVDDWFFWTAVALLVLSPFIWAPLAWLF